MSSDCVANCTAIYKRPIPPSETKGNSSEVTEKTKGQLCIIHAVGPKKKAVAVAESNKLSLVTGQFLGQMRNTNYTFPACIQRWAKLHETVEFIDKLQFEFPLKIQSEIPTELNLPPLREWEVSTVVEWMRTLKLSQDYSSKIINGALDGEIFANLYAEGNWEDLGFSVTGDVYKIKLALKKLKTAI